MFIGHCRRRKIRCIPAPADPQQRCSNCIRLKKECNFFPVDQQPPDTRQRDSKDRSGTGQASKKKRQRTESFSPETKGTLPSVTQFQFFCLVLWSSVITSSRTFDHSHGPTNWMAPDASPNTPPNYWQVNPQDSPVTPAFSPFTLTLHVPPGQNWQAHHAAPSPREDLSWSVPQRSVPYSDIEGLQSHQYTPFPQATTHSITDNYTTKPRVMQSGTCPFAPNCGKTNHNILGRQAWSLRCYGLFLSRLAVCCYFALYYRISLFIGLT